MSVNHQQHMQRCLVLALRGESSVSPNPMVGSVVTRGGQVVGEGAHPRLGGPHAEVVALRRAGRLARNGTLYVSLEPCCHQGRTGPCTEVIVDSGVRRVVVPMRDPYPLDDG